MVALGNSAFLRRLRWSPSLPVFSIIILSCVELGIRLELFCGSNHFRNDTKSENEKAGLRGCMGGNTRDKNLGKGDTSKEQDRWARSNIIILPGLRPVGFVRPVQPRRFRRYCRTSTESSYPSTAA